MQQEELLVLVVKRSVVWNPVLFAEWLAAKASLLLAAFGAEQVQSAEQEAAAVLLAELLPVAAEAEAYEQQLHALAALLVKQAFASEQVQLAASQVAKCFAYAVEVWPHAETAWRLDLREQLAPLHFYIAGISELASLPKTPHWHAS